MISVITLRAANVPQSLDRKDQKHRAACHAHAEPISIAI
jgi:hypothetical protein